MEAKYRRSGYWKDKIQGWVDDNGKYHSGLKDLSWAYVKPATIEQLEENRQSLLDAIRSEDQDYILDTWLLKEKRVIYCLIRIWGLLQLSRVNPTILFYVRLLMHNCPWRILLVTYAEKLHQS